MTPPNPPGLRILVTGGTFDKDYHELEGKLYFRETHVPEMLRLGRCELSVAVEALMFIDSLEMDDSHRQRILAACRSAPERSSPAVDIVFQLLIKISPRALDT